MGYFIGYMILDLINSPEDLKMIAPDRLPILCRKIRELIIDTTSKNGGHAAPSLGVVELAVALHYVFDSPDDKIIWDVGHQSYAHKILTGRRHNFHTIRMKGGISGFPKMSESPHDAFGTGHSSTSISAALGIAHAFEREGKDARAIAVIGDGSMTGGLAFEALNQAGYKTGRLVVILNDNEMSISKNVGALSKFLSTRLHGKTAGRLKRALKRLLSIMPVLGKKIYHVAEKAEESTIGFFTPGYMFEAFGCDYIGPLDGHNLDELIRVFRDIKDSPIGDKPIIVHVLTKKGKGYAPAEENPTLFHGIGPFDKMTGKPVSDSALTYSKAFSKALMKCAERDEKIIAITAAMKTGTGLEEFAQKYPSRFFDVGIAEGHAVTFAAGLASQGLKPVIAIYSTFLQRAFDHMIHDVCLQNLPVVFAIDRAGLVGDDGPTHHGVFDISYLRMMPNMIVMAPKDDHLLGEMLELALKLGVPSAIRYPRGAVPSSFMGDGNWGGGQPLALGKAEMVYDSPAPSISIWAVGHLVPAAVEAAEKLKKKGIGAIVVDPRFIKPFDFVLFTEIVDKCPNILTVEENVASGGFGSMISEFVVEKKLKNINLSSIALPDAFVEHASQNELREKYGFDADGIARSAVELLKNRRQSVGEDYYEMADTFEAGRISDFL